jgi:hypothetical protein
MELGESRRERYIKAHLTIRTHAMKTKDLHLGNFELGFQFGSLVYTTERVRSLAAVCGPNLYLESQIKWRDTSNYVSRTV